MTEADTYNIKLNPNSPVLDHDTFDQDDLDHLKVRYGHALNPLLCNVEEFMIRGSQLDGIKFGDKPSADHRKRRRHWLAGKDEGEVGEFLNADFSNDLVEYIDGAIDVSYIAFGALLEACQGEISVADLLIKEVMRSNDTKLVECVIRPDGKVQKGPHFQQPRIKAILDFCNIEVPGTNLLFKNNNGDRISASNYDKNGDHNA